LCQEIQLYTLPSQEITSLPSPKRTDLHVIYGYVFWHGWLDFKIHTPDSIFTQIIQPIFLILEVHVYSNFFKNILETHQYSGRQTGDVKQRPPTAKSETVQNLDVWAT
jgi:hypothetical protein